MVSLSVILICCGAALVAGFIDAIAGGGGLITLPALLLANVPAHNALACNKISAALGTATAVGTFARSHLIQWRVALVGVVAALLGSAIGSQISLLFDNAILGKILVCLLPFGMAATLLPKKDMAHDLNVTSGPRLWLLTPLVCLCIGIYDGFYGPGTGSFIILALHFIVRVGLIQASATSKVINLGSNIGPSTRYLYDASFLRIRNLAVGYTIPKRICEKIGMSSIRISANIQNLWTFDSYPGYSVEANYQGNSATNNGVDFGGYPIARIMTLGVNINF